jgi:hypothetical protein
VGALFDGRALLTYGLLDLLVIVAATTMISAYSVV